MDEEPKVTISIANCSGRSNIGQMSLEIAKKIDKTLPYANINCLPAISPKLKPASKFFEADAVVVIDGCSEACVLKTIELAGLKPALRIAPDEDYGVEKKPGLDFDQETMNRIADDVIRKIEKLAEEIRQRKMRQAVEKANV